MSATTDEKIRNALNMYNGGLQTKLTNKFVEKVTGKTLSTNDFTDALKNKLDAVATDTYVQKVTGKNLSTNDFTDDYKSTIDGMSSIYAKKTEVASVMTYKGSVDYFTDLPTDTSILSIGDVYNISVGGGTDNNGTVIKGGDNVAWTGAGWDDFGGAVDLTNYVQKVNGKTLSTNDFTDEDKAKLDSLSTDTQTVDLTGVMRVYIGSVAPTDTSVIWFDTSAYSN